MARDTEHTDNVICPHCGTENFDSWELELPDTEADKEIECSDCNKPFMARRIMTITYTTRIKEDQ